MKIKKRLIYTNTLTILIPLAITFLTAFIIIYLSSFISRKDLNYENFKELTAIKTELWDMSSGVSKQLPEAFEGGEYWEHLAQRLSVLRGKLVVLRNDKTIFTSEDMSKINIEKSLEASKSKFVNNSLKLDDTSYFFQVVDFKYKDGMHGKALLLAPIADKPFIIEGFILILTSVFILSFAAMNAVMSYFLSKSIIKPVSLLKKAASEISNGNLNYEVAEDGDAEIRELCRDFETMRLQLKDSVHEKLVYDDNRKMLVSSISHDLKTPITSIKGYVEGILDGVATTPEKIEEYLKTIYSKANQVDVMIDDLLLYSKLDLHQLPFNFERTDIVDYFSYCVSECSIELSKYSIGIVMENNLSNTKDVLIDRVRMRRVITNIIDNSRKYMKKENGQIKIILRETNSSILAELRDNGSGISKDDVNRIFDRFYRANAARTGTDGSGLGLAIAKQIVEGHKGRIWAVSHGSEGTSIIVSLAKLNSL